MIGVRYELARIEMLGGAFAALDLARFLASQRVTFEEPWADLPRRRRDDAPDMATVLAALTRPWSFAYDAARREVVFRQGEGAE